MTVSGEIEGDDLCFSCFLAAEGFIDDNLHGVSRLRGRQDPFRPGKLQGGVEGRELVNGDRLDVTVVVQCTDLGGHAVVTKPAGVNARRHESASQRVHFHHG